MAEPELTALVAAQRQCFAAGTTRDVRHRILRLKALQAALHNSRAEILRALNLDLHKCEAEALLSEFLPVMESVKYMIRNVRRLSRSRRASPSPYNWPAAGKLVPEPYGVAGIIATWNYPVLLALDPLIGAVAAGNCVVLKVATQAAATAIALAEIVQKVFPPEEAAVTTVELPDFLSQRYDTLFFTGGADKGKQVLAAAAPNLTPCTLELGGKSPCIVDQDANVKLAAKRIVWGKFLNAGQTCVAPDYLLVHSRIKEPLTQAIRAEIQKQYGDNPAESPDYARIIHRFHYDRLTALLSEGRLITGGEHNPDDLYIAPTVIDEVTFASPVMQEEIFGPILPVLEFDTIGDAIALVNARPKPLALYYFGRSRKNRRRIVNETSSGSVGINDAVNQLMNLAMPFGGVGASGMGAYHGRFSFANFSHLKPVQRRWFLPEPPLRFPPWSVWKRWIMRMVSR